MLVDNRYEDECEMIVIDEKVAGKKKRQKKDQLLTAVGCSRDLLAPSNHPQRCQCTKTWACRTLRASDDGDHHQVLADDAVRYEGMQKRGTAV